MKAKLTVYIAGEPDRSPGELVVGDEAVRLCAAGYALPVVEQREKAVKKVAAKETREVE